MKIYKPSNAEDKVHRLVMAMPEFTPIQSRKGNYVYEVDGYRISIGPNYSYSGRTDAVSFRIYKVTEDNLVLVKVGATSEVFEHLPARFAEAILYQLDLLT